MSEANERKCSIEGCGKKTFWDEGLYCDSHENMYDHEYGVCMRGGCERWYKAPAIYCSLHGGADYTPRTREEGESSTPASTPCIVCGVPIGATTRDAEPWAFEGERGHREGQVHSGCRGFVEERRGQG